MSDKNLIDEMNQYYRTRAPWHDEYLSYTSNAQMEKLLGPFIEFFEDNILNQDILEIACGTGNWTQVLAKRARYVLATDVADSMIEIARKKPYQNNKVKFIIANAYTLKRVEGPFTCAFAADWFSHIPKSSVRPFLKVLHSKLAKGARVVLVDMMYRDHPDLSGYHSDEEGNLIKRRKLPNGQKFDVVKNYPTKEELLGYLKGMAEDIKYREHLGLLRWMLAYRVV